MKGRKPEAPNVVPLREGAASAPAPEPYDDMSVDAAATWRELAPDLAMRGRLKPAYRPMFRVWCEAFSDVLKFTYDLHTMGDYFRTETRNGLQEKKRAAWGQRQDAIANMTRIGALFGLTPLDEARFGPDGQKDLLAMLKETLDG
ncbi:P27 family phage terminase small subunit [Paroceanicella profunda]|uniref:P27 family phage terminase small subunit n=1 Tax=Paroceanicella profunda TaxID=2579971 RepID=A0A5B8FY34_9RHOB|nr:P27 family phage terminase small subunit [Paroceanicella profunda]QDL91509.1 P27 family phage terminase small subunit [Paroceanicella profunda]